MGKCLAVTGHRKQKLKLLMDYENIQDNAYNSYLKSINDVIENHLLNGFDRFITGGALGVDLNFAEIFENIKIKKNLKAQLEIAIPCFNQDLKWEQPDKDRYKKIIEQADNITQICNKYTKWCMQKRNEYMVNNADKIVAFWNGEKNGGTWNAIKYANKLGKELEILNYQQKNKARSVLYLFLF